MIKECDCRFCQQKMASQASYIQDLQNRYQEKCITILPDYGAEVKGERLNQVAEDLYGKGQMETVCS